MRLQVDAAACRSYAICIGIAPEYFELDDDGLLVLKGDEVQSGDEDRVREAAAVCPTLAITVVDE